MRNAFSSSDPMQPIVQRNDFSSSDPWQAIEAFAWTRDARDAEDRAIAFKIRQRLHSDLYRREREIYPELIDLGGEA